MSKDSGGKEARQQLMEEQARQGRIRQGVANINSTFDGQFNDAFYDQRRDAYTNYQLPQLDDQAKSAGRELTYSLARGGLLNSSVRGTQGAELQKKQDLQRQTISDQAIAEAAKSRSGIEDARADLIRTVNATGDAQGATTAALNRASALSQPAAYSPLGDVFATFTSGLGKQAALERAASYGSPFTPRYDTGLFGLGQGATRVTQ